MIRYGTTLLLLAALTGCRQESADTDAAAPAEATEEGDNQVQQAPDWMAEFEEMKTALQLTPEETENIKTAFEERKTQYTEWMQANGARLEQLERDMKAAARAKDLSKVRDLVSRAKPLRTALRDLLATSKDGIEAVLSDDNRLAWAAHQLETRLLDLMTTLDLTAEQINQIGDEAIKAVRGAVSELNPEAAGFLALEKAVESNVLTPQQREAYEVKKKKNPMRSLK